MDKTVGVLGGGQLGRMLAEAANLLDIRVNFLDAPGSSAKQVSNHDGHVDGSFKDREAIKKLAAKSDVVTVEIEHVDTEILEEISSTTDVQPSWKTIRIIQDKFLQKGHLHKHGVATAESLPLEAATVQELERVGQQLGFPFMLKSRREAYDGRGNFPVKSKDDFAAALAALGANKLLYAEKWAQFKMELAVMVVKTATDVLSFPTVETVHENSICKLTYAPARGVSVRTSEAAQALARKAVASFEGKGVFGVEMFLLRHGASGNDDDHGSADASDSAADVLLVNEIAPRPHNSGHYTIEACAASQFDAHLSAILDLPLTAADLALREPAIMLNILGGAAPDSHMRVAREALRHRRAKLHLYGKGGARPGRKMGHLTVCAATMAEAERLMQPLADFIDAGFQTPPPPPPASSQSPQLQQSPSSAPPPVVAVVMGSDSDLPVLAPGLAVLEQLGIGFAARVTSAHRTPRWMAAFARGARAQGFLVLIAAAGGAAHLPGMAAAHTSLPVVGVPVKPSVGDGTDSVLSILNMPRGVPVATVSVNNSVNAALLAARMLAMRDGAVAARLEAYIDAAEREVLAKDAKLAELGAQRYLAEAMGKK